jgi:large subunit ribosomal protein L5
MNRIKMWYKIVLKKDNIYKLKNKNIFSIQKLNKIVINLNLNEAINDSKQILLSIIALDIITNQNPILYHSKKSISAFKLKKYCIIGCKNTIRNNFMYNFLDSFIFIVLPKLISFSVFVINPTMLTNTISFGVLDLLIFSSLNQSSELFLKKLGGTFSFFTKFKNINYIINSYQIPFKL